MKGYPPQLIKSFWTAALSSEGLRALLGQSVHELEHADVYVGFAVTSSIDAFPMSMYLGN